MANILAKNQILNLVRVHNRWNREPKIGSGILKKPRSLYTGGSIEIYANLEVCPDNAVRGGRDVIR